MKMTNFDRFMAILRCSEYNDDYNKLVRLRKQKIRLRKQKIYERIDKHISYMERKWGVYPLSKFTPDIDHLQEPLRKTVREKIKKQFPDLRILNGPIPTKSYDERAVVRFVEQPDFKNYPPFSFVVRHKGRPIGSSEDFKTYTEGKVERYLYLRIDLDSVKRDMTQTNKEIKEILQYCVQYIQKQNSRYKTNSKNCWLIYDLNEKCQNLKEVTRLLNGDKTQYRTIYLSYQKACGMIRQIEKEIKKASHKPPVFYV